MSAASRVYTEHDVEQFFDQTLRNYLSFWDTDGVLHTGYFAGDNHDDYRAAAQETSAVLAAEAMLDGSSHVLDVGSGCGNFLMYLARQHGCSGEGLDLSEQRVTFALDRLADEKDLRITFRHGSATQMPYQPGTFTHVVSQDALCLVPDKPRSHAEIERVLAPGGIFAFSDFLQPKEQVSERARQARVRPRALERRLLPHRISGSAGQPRIRDPARAQSAQPHPADLSRAGEDGYRARGYRARPGGERLDAGLRRVVPPDEDRHR